MSDQPTSTTPVPPEAEPVVEERVLDDNYVYNVEELQRPATELELPDHTAQLHHSFGLECTRRSNIHFISDETVILAAGNNVQFLNIYDHSVQYLPGIDGGGIGAVAVHPSRRFFAVAEKGVNPNVYIYKYPSLEVFRVLRLGTEQAYSAVAFNKDGEQLATVGSFPDYMLTVWNWRMEKIVLRSKAFAQEVYKVAFSPFYDGRLITSGMGHIRFWKMAETFTGLKLQGLIGKFGQVELSDITAYIELPSGIVLSGTESGNLLLWDGNTIKCEVSRKGARPCHKGNVDVLFFSMETGLLLSAGEDGYVRTWDYTALENAEPSDDSPIFELEPLTEVRVGDNVKIRDMIKGNDFWLALDAGGGLWRLEGMALKPNRLLECHAGAVTGVATCPVSQVAASSGVDGSVRVFDYVSKKSLVSAHFASAASTLTWLPAEADATGRSILVGFEDGVIRELVRCKDGLVLRVAMKPHTQRVTAIAFNVKSKIIATASQDGTVFFIKYGQSYTPIGFVSLGDTAINSIVWSDDGKKLLACCANGRVSTIGAPENSQEFDTTASYEISLPIKDALFKGGPREVVEGQPPAPSTLSPALAAAYLDEERFIISLGGLDIGNLYEITMESTTPIKTFPGHTSACTVLQWSRSRKYLLSGSEHGTVHISHANDPTHFWTAGPHDGSGIGRLGAGDGLCYVYQIEGEMAANTDAAEAKVTSMTESGVSPAEDITDSGSYSIQQDKLKAEQDRQLALADNKKKDVRTVIAEMRHEFEQLIHENSLLPAEEQMPNEAFDIDPEYRAMMESEADERVTIARKELQWISAKKQLQLDRLRGHYLDTVAFERLVLHPFGKTGSVATFRTPHLSSELKSAIVSVHTFLESEQIRMRQMKEAEEQKQAMILEAAGAEMFAAQSQIAGTNGRSRLTSKMQGLSKVDIRKGQRAERQKLWDDLNSKKPSEKFELMEDVMVIKQAQENMGDYKLKTAKDYVVPEHLRISAEKKKREMILLEEAVYLIKADFNERLLALRELKIRIIENIKKHNGRICEVNALLGINENVVDPKMLMDEITDRRKRWEDVKADKDLLLNYERQKIRTERKAQREARKAAAGGFGGFGGGTGGQGAADEDGDSDDEGRSAAVAAAEAKQQQRTTVAGRAAAERAAKLAAERASAIEEEEKYANRIRLTYEREALQQKIAETTKAFDDALQEMRRERLKLEGDMKATDLKMLLLYQELVKLKEDEKTDQELTAELDQKRSDEADMITKITDSTHKLAQRKSELEQVVEIDKKLVEEFNQMVPESHPFRKQLLSTYKKKIKRKPKKNLDDSNEGDEESDEEYEDDESDFDEGSGEEEDELADQPPPGHESTFQKVCELREKRLDNEEKVQEIRKIVEVLGKEHMNNSKVLSDITEKLTNLNVKIQNHQTRKQQRLNELDMIITLRMHQLQCLVEDALPNDMSSILVFTRDGLRNLDARTDTLKKENSGLKVKRANLKKTVRDLEAQLKDWDTSIAELRARVLDVQLLKFGRKIDLEKLDSMTVNKEADELKDDLHDADKKRAVELEEWDWQISQSKEMLSAVTQENTEKQRKLGDLLEQNYRLETALNATQGKMVADVGVSAARREKEDQERLMQLVRAQAQEIESLRAEISVLSHKGGHVYTPAVGRQ